MTTPQSELNQLIQFTNSNAEKDSIIEWLKNVLAGHSKEYKALQSDFGDITVITIERKDHIIDKEVLKKTFEQLVSQDVTVCHDDIGITLTFPSCHDLPTLLKNDTVSYRR